MKDPMKIKASILTRIALLLVAALLLASAAVFTFGYEYMLDTAEEQSVEISQAATAAAMTAIGSEEGFYALYEDEAFREKVHQTFRFICRRTTLRYLYLYTVGEDGYRHYVICAADSDGDDMRLQNEYGFGSVGYTPLYQAEKNVLDRRVGEDHEMIDNEYGYVCMNITPVIDGEGRIIALIGADDGIEDVERIAARDLITLLLLGMMVFTLTYVIALLLIRSSVTRPILKLSERMRSFAADRKASVDANRRKTVFVDEITDIENAFEKMTVDIRQYVSDIEALTREQVYTQTQLDVAMKIQSGIVPGEEALSDERLEIYGWAQAARTVGGDFYDVFRLDDGRIAAMVGDISDKGISAALFMVMVKTSIKEKLKAGRGPAETLNLVNRELCASNPENMFATVFALILHPETGVASYANAGHEAPLVLGKETAYLKMKRGIALGLFEDSFIAEEKLVLRGGDGLLLYTDGITEAIDAEKRQYGKDRLRETLSREDRDCDARALVEAVIASVRAHTGGTEQYDDITCLALVYKDHEEEVSLVPEVKSFKTVKNAILSALGESEHTKRVILACEEIFVNIVSYSGADQIVFRSKRSGNTWMATYEDDGAAFDPVKAERKSVEFEDLDQGGMGILVARRNTRDMIYNRIGGRNVLTLVFDAPITAEQQGAPC